MTEPVFEQQNVKLHKIRRNREQILKEALILLKKNDYSQNELAQRMGYSGVSKTFNSVIESMIKDGLIKYSVFSSERSPNLKLQIIHSDNK